MEFVFEKDEGVYHTKIQIKNGFIILFGKKNLDIILIRNIQRTTLSYWKRIKEEHKILGICSQEECEEVHVEFFHNNPTTSLTFRPKNQERLNIFHNFILTITNPNEQVNKIDDIFDFLIGQKRFEENKDLL